MCTNVYHKLYWLHHLLVMQMDREVVQCTAYDVMYYTIYLSCKWTEK